MGLLPKVKKSKPPKKQKHGRLSKRALTFLDMCKDEFAFEPAKEFIELYSKESRLYQELFSEYGDKGKRLGMSVADIAMFWKLHAELKDSLKTFIRYSYPTLRAMDIKGGSGVRPIFNINLGVPPPFEEEKEPPIDITPEEK